MDTAIKSDDWDIIGIFPGTGDGNMHSGHEAYELLGDLIEYIKSLASPKVKLLYSLTWLSDKENPKKELALYNGNQELVMSMICDRIREYVIPTNEFWRIIPFGTAVQNARNENILITRDGYHLSYGLGRFMAALTFVGSITDVDISQISWMPTVVTENEKNLAVRFAQRAILDPYQFKQFENK
ncbi:MAG: DUF4886 domain-containing protein [Lachnospiraceae bacterium]|nr:DUF4886 domain-containing protein [Lachnospiraceae bacterium]